MTRTIAECLETLGVDDFGGCETLEQEFAMIKKTYFARVLVCHPDKGGDAAEFREVRASFEVLRGMYQHHSVDSFATASGKAHVADNYETVFHDFETGPMPSYEFFYEAAQEEVPLYAVELAKSDRSQCLKCKNNKKKQNAVDLSDETALMASSNAYSNETALSTKRSIDPDCVIAKGTIRVGSLEEKTGTYTRWHHLDCWRVPSRIWQGLPDPSLKPAPGAGTDDADYDVSEKTAQALLGMEQVLLTGFGSLDADEQNQFLQHVMNKKHWAKLYKRKQKPPTEKEQAAVAAKKTTTVVTSDHYPAKKAFVLPVPGHNGALVNCFDGQRFVLTGIFPEVGGGTGLSLGKQKVKNMIERFGGRVTGSISGLTNVVVVGKEPGLSKVSKARAKGIALLDLRGLHDAIHGTALEDASPPVITDFSSGYTRWDGSSNSLALKASEEELEMARTGTTTMLTDGDQKMPAKKKTITAKGSKKKPAKKTKLAIAASEVVDLTAAENEENSKNSSKKSAKMNAAGKKKPKRDVEEKPASTKAAKKRGAKKNQDEGKSSGSVEAAQQPPRKKYRTRAVAQKEAV